MKAKGKLILALSAAMFMGCSGQRQVHVLNMHANKNGFVDASGAQNKCVSIPKEILLINEIPGSGSSQGNNFVRVFTATPLRLSNGTEDLVHFPQRVPIEECKFILELHNSSAIPDMAASLEYDTMAVLRYVGNSIPNASWDVDTVRRGTTTLRLVLRPSGYRKGDMIYQHDWLCSSFQSKSIFEIRPGQRIKARP